MALDMARKISFKPTSRRSSHGRRPETYSPGTGHRTTLCRASAQVHKFSALTGIRGPRLALPAIWEACSSGIRRRVTEPVQHRPGFPVVRAERARILAGAQVRRRAWKSALFTGGPGSGKSRAAAVIARAYQELGVLPFGACLIGHEFQAAVVIGHIPGTSRRDLPRTNENR
jgi:hypothetical protein